MLEVETVIRCAVDAREYSVPGRLTGIGRFLTNILAPLAAAPDEFEFHLLTHAPGSVPSRLQQLPGIRIRELPARESFMMDQFLLAREARAAGVDLFFSPFYGGPLLLRIPLIVTVHDIMLLRFPTLLPARRMLLRLYLRLVIARSRRIITVSSFTERDLVSMFPAAAEKTSVMYSDIGQEWFRTLCDRSPAVPPAVSPERFGKFFLYVGTFKPHKNVDLLIKGYHAALQAGGVRDHALVLIGGDDENMGRILRLIKRLELERRTYVCRDIDDYSLSRFYQAADWFVTASAYEGYGYPPVEAMLAGCPVLCHPVTSLIEVVGSAAMPIHALTVDEIMASLTRAASLPPAERQDYCAAGERQVRLFRPGQTAAAFARLCRAVVHASGSRTGAHGGAAARKS